MLRYCSCSFFDGHWGWRSKANVVLRKCRQSTDYSTQLKHFIIAIDIGDGHSLAAIRYEENGHTTKDDYAKDFPARHTWKGSEQSERRSKGIKGA